jgi:uncharacterized membrane protein YdjX (TVP38/TMEM64 family)
MARAHHWLTWFERNKVWILWGTLIFVALAGFVRRDWIAGHLLGGWAEATPDPVLLLAVFVWFFVSQLVILPSGTLSILMTGALFGWWVGLLYYVAMFLSGQLLHLLARQDRGAARQALARALPEKLRHGVLWRLMERAERRGIATTVMLRLLPIAPSAICPLIVGSIGGASGRLAVGTLLSGWARPVSIALVGQAAGHALLAPERLMSEVAQPVLWVALVSLGLSSLAAYLIVRPLPQRDPPSR